MKSKEHDQVDLDFKPPVFYGGNVIQDELDHWIGYKAAAQMVGTKKELPLHGIFHADDQTKVWSMAREIVTLSAKFPTPEDADKDLVYETVTKTLKECKLDIPFEFA